MLTSGPWWTEQEAPDIGNGIDPLSSPACGCAVLRTHWLLFLGWTKILSLHPLPLFFRCLVLIFCVSISYFKLGVSKKGTYQAQYGDWAGHILFCFPKNYVLANKAEAGQNKAKQACWLVSQRPIRRLTKGEVHTILYNSTLYYTIPSLLCDNWLWQVPVETSIT